MSKTYEIVSGPVTIEEKEYITYGVKCNKTGKIVENVFREKEKMEELIDKMNEFELDPLHMEDVIDDSLVD